MNRPDDFVVQFLYCDRNGNFSKRIVSPIRFVGNNRFLALCLTREEPRQFCLDYCRQIELKPAWDYVMPVHFEDN
ncbi:MAG: hypothetical protein AAF939_18705 [Planctomycetota bacterium]